MALMFTIGGVMRGAGDTVATMLLTLVSLWLFRVPLAKYLSSIPELGVGGVWLGIAMVRWLVFYSTSATTRRGAGKGGCLCKEPWMQKATDVDEPKQGSARMSGYPKGAVVRPLTPTSNTPIAYRGGLSSIGLLPPWWSCGLVEPSSALAFQKQPLHECHGGATPLLFLDSCARFVNGMGI